MADTPFCEEMSLAQLHWMLADRSGCTAIEQTADGLHVYNDPAGVLANNPPFPMHLFALNKYAQLSPKASENRFLSELSPQRYNRGMGTLGLPGDLSSQSHFVRAALVWANSRAGDSKAERVSQFFHILSAAAVSWNAAAVIH